MIRNNLAVLLAERQIKITRVAKDTGISRSTVTSIAQNDTKMIQLEVINALCMYLNIEPKDFFVYVPIDLEYKVMFDNKNINFEMTPQNDSLPIKVHDFSFDLFIDVTDKKYYEEKRTYELRGKSKKISIAEELLPFSSYEMDIDLSFVDENKDKELEFKNTVSDALDPTFKITIKNELVSSILSELINELLEFYKEQIGLERFHKPERIELKEFFSRSKIRIIKNII